MAKQRTLTLAGLAFAAASGTLSGMSLVLAKAAVELLVITIDQFHTGRGENQFARAQSWFLVAGLGIGAVLQLVYLNYSLSFASPALICPLAFCFFNLSSIFGEQCRSNLTGIANVRIDGLVFYDQFGQLKPYQITLVSVGVAILLLGVWVVSLIRPAGDGIEVGTWVEDEDESESGENFFAEPYHDDSETLEEAVADVDAVETQTPTQAGHSRRRSILTSPQSPTSATFVSSPMSPLSPTTRRRHPPRYGTLMPEYAPIGAPTGFSIGLGAASPGFVLRSSSLGGGHRRGRTQSEGQAGIIAIMEQGHQSGEHADPEARRSSLEQANLDPPQEHASDDTLHSGHERRPRWWREVWQKRNKGSIQIPSDDAS